MSIQFGLWLAVARSLLQDALKRESLLGVVLDGSS